MILKIKRIKIFNLLYLLKFKIEKLKMKNFILLIFHFEMKIAHFCIFNKDFPY